MRKPKLSRRSLRPKRAGRQAAQLIARTTRLLLRGDHQQALSILRLAIPHHPGNASVLTRYADALYQQQYVSEARDAYRRTLALDQGEFQAWYGCGMAEFSLGNYAEAIQCLQRAVALVPRDTDANLYLGHSLFQMGDVDGAIDAFIQAAECDDAAVRRQALRHVALIIPGSPLRTNGQILRARRMWARLEERCERSRPLRTARRAKSRKLRVGYVSSFFHHRNWMKAVWGMINQHDRSAFEVHLFADEGYPSAESGYRANPQDCIHVIGGRSNEEAAASIAAAGIDVLVDLNGYSAPQRLGVFMRKPAPVIVGWFNMYATTGIRAFDYIIGDGAVIPPEEDRFYTERVLRVSGCYVAFAVLYPVPSIRPPPCLRTGHITFACLAPQYKITDQVISAHAQILLEAPNARLLFKNACLGDASNQAALHRRFARLGVQPERIALEGPAEHYEFLETYRRVDVALDTFPYNGGTTTMEALWQGVPVLTFNGDRWAARISRSILAASRLQDWIEPSLEAYIRRGVRLAVSSQTPRSLAALRANMRRWLAASPAWDCATLCRDIEAHFRVISDSGY